MTVSAFVVGAMAGGLITAATLFIIGTEAHPLPDCQTSIRAIR